MILRIQVTKIAGYDEDIVFLVVPDESEFSRGILLMMGTYMLGRIVHVIKESELDRLSTSWVMVRASCLLSRQGTVVVDLGTAGDGPAEEGVAACKSSQSSEIKLILMKENVRLGPFQTQILGV